MWKRKRDRLSLTDDGVSLFTSLTAIPIPKTMVRLVLGELQQNRSIALKAAEDLAGCSREVLADRLRAAPRSVNRLARLLHAAGLTGHDEVLRMMGYVLTRGLIAEENGNAVDEEEDDRILDTLPGLAPRHVRMMSVIEQRPGIDNVALAAALPADRFTDQTSNQLLDRGYVSNPYGKFGGDNGEDRFWQLSDLGRLVLELGGQVGLVDPLNRA